MTQDKKQITLTQALSVLASDPPFDGKLVEQTLRESLAALERRLSSIRRPKARVGAAESPTLGRLLIALSESGVAMVQYADSKRALLAGLLRLRRKFELVEDSLGAARLAEELTRYSLGEKDHLDHPVDLSLVEGEFSRQALLALVRDVSRGMVVTYRRLALRLKAPRSARAIGNAMNLNPVAIYVPCHRVLASDLSLGGYAGGLARKALLLRAEGFALDDKARRLADKVVWGSETAKIFCRIGCPAANRADKARGAFFAAPEIALAAGLRPCRICRPA